MSDEMYVTRDGEFRYAADTRGGTLRSNSPEALKDALADLAKRERAEAERRALWGDCHKQGMERLCALFPTLRGAPGTAPWDPMRVLEHGLATGGGAYHAAMFVLSVWNTGTDWLEIARGEGWVSEECGHVIAAHLCRFHVARAFATWDDAHREAFLAWAHTPFFP